jgi:hypothetical protein
MFNAVGFVGGADPETVSPFFLFQVRKQFPYQRIKKTTGNR